MVLIQDGAGILPSQYAYQSMFSGIGVVGHAYIRRGLIYFMQV